MHWRPCLAAGDALKVAQDGGVGVTLHGFAEFDDRKIVERVAVFLPRFQVNPAASVSLSKELQALGVGFGQMLVPVATLLTIVARRLGTDLLAVATLVFLMFALGVMLSARSSRGRQQLEVRSHRLSINNITITRAEVTRWSWNGARALLQGEGESWALSAVGAPEPVRLALVSVLGPPRVMVRRGSPRARTWAAAAGVAGLLSFPLIILFNLPILLPVSVVLFLAGFATFGAFSQRITRIE